MSKEADGEDADGGQLARHGNFNNYYKFHSVDQRLSALSWLPSLVAQHCPHSAAFLDQLLTSAVIAETLPAPLPRSCKPPCPMSPYRAWASILTRHSSNDATSTRALAKACCFCRWMQLSLIFLVSSELNSCPRSESRASTPRSCSASQCGCTFTSATTAL